MTGPKSPPASFLSENASPRVFFFSGALLFPAFLMQSDLVVRALQIALFMALNAFTGRRVRLIQFLVVSAGIVLCNLVIPTGRVLVTVLGLALTEGALKSGLFKATAMTGLIALSQFSIRSDLRLPGRIGGLIGRSFFYFEKIMGERRKIDRKDIIGSIDSLLLDVQAESSSDAPAAQARPRSSPRGIAILSILVCLIWGVFLFTLIHPRPLWGG